MSNVLMLMSYSMYIKTTVDLLPHLLPYLVEFKDSVGSG